MVNSLWKNIQVVQPLPELLHQVKVEQRSHALESVFVAPASLLHLAQHHLGMSDIKLVQLIFVTLGIYLGNSPVPVIAGDFPAVPSFHQKDHVGGDLRVSVFFEGIDRQPYRAQEPGVFGKVGANFGLQAIHREAAGDEGDQSARPHQVEGLDEVVVVQAHIGQMAAPIPKVAGS